MAIQPERVLAIDVDERTVRGIVLANETPAVAGGYAQLAYEPAQSPVSFAARIAAALDVKATMPVAITCDAALGDDVVGEIAAAITETGFADVTITSRIVAERRANPAGGPPEALTDVQIPSGLLTSHAGLTLADLAPVVGAGLELLGGATAEPDHGDPPVAVWSPASEAPPAPDTDPFTSQPVEDPVAKAKTLAAAAVAAAAAAVGDDDDLTVPAPADRLTAPNSPDPSGSTATDSDTPDRHMPLIDEDSATEVAEHDEVTSPAPVAVAVTPDEGPADPFAELNDEDVTVNPDPLAADFDQDATVNPGESSAVPSAAVAAAAEGNLDDSAAGIDRFTVRSGPAVVPETAAPSTVAGADASGGSSKRPVWILLVAIGVLALIGLAISQCGGSDASSADQPAAQEPVAAEPEAEAPSSTEAQAAEAAEPTVETPDPTAEPAPEPTVAPTATAEPEPEPEPTVDPLAGLPPLSSLPERGAIFRPPTLFLEGPVQTQEQADELYARAIAVVGPDNVVNNYVVRPDAPEALDGNVRVEQAVLFQSGSAVVAEQFIPTLELGVAVMALNPQVQMVVEGHTDAVGSAASNVVLSQQRAEAVVTYLVSRGVAIDRLDAVGLGESTPVDTNETAEGRQVNRRIEVNLLDLLAGD